MGFGMERSFPAIFSRLQEDISAIPVLVDVGGTERDLPMRQSGSILNNDELRCDVSLMRVEHFGCLAIASIGRIGFIFTCCVPGPGCRESIIYTRRRRPSHAK